MLRVLEIVRDADDKLVRALNGLARANSAVRIGTALCARWLSFVEIGLMLLLGATGRRSAAWQMLVAVASVYAACEFGGLVWRRRRPFERLDGISPLSAHAGGRSFPSRHVASGLAMAAIGKRAHPGLGALMEAIAWMLGLSRVMAGLHYPSDVISAAPLAAAVSFFVMSVGGDCHPRA